MAPPVRQDLRFETPSGLSVIQEKVKVDRTPITDPLTDGSDPSFLQWRVSIRDRLRINAAYYPTEDSRKALVWGQTKGLARKYLEPRYMSETDSFHTAKEMLDTLSTYFLTGTEAEEARKRFHTLRMRDKAHPTETFPEFRARFQLEAIQGNVAKTEWFFYMWEKLHYPLRVVALASKKGWKNSYEEMVSHLTDLDLERRQIVESVTIRSVPDKKLATQPTIPRPMAKASQPYTMVTRSRQTSSPNRGFQPKTSSPALSGKDPARCFTCGSTKHFANVCPDKATIKEMLVEEDEDLAKEEEEYYESEEVQKGNEEA